MNGDSAKGSTLTDDDMLYDVEGAAAAAAAKYAAPIAPLPQLESKAAREAPRLPAPAAGAAQLPGVVSVMPASPDKASPPDDGGFGAFGDAEFDEFGGEWGGFDDVGTLAPAPEQLPAQLSGRSEPSGRSEGDGGEAVARLGLEFAAAARARAAFDAAFRRDAAASLLVAEAAVSVRLCTALVRRAGARLHLFTAARL